MSRVHKAIEPTQCGLGVGALVRIRLVGSGDHHDLNTELTRRHDLGLRRRAARVLAHDHLDRALAHQRQLIDQREWAALQNDVGERRQIDRIWRVDCPHHIPMLRRVLEHRQLVATDSEKHASALRPQRRARRLGICDLAPIIVALSLPGRPMQSQQRQTAFPRSRNGVDRDARGVRMRRIDHHVDGFMAQPSRKPFSTTEPADARTSTRQQWRRCAASKGIDRAEAFIERQLRRQCACLSRAAEDEDAHD